MERRPRTRTTLAGSLLAFTLIAPWALGQDRDLITATRLAAEQGDARAQFALGLMYRDGRGVAQDDAEAVRWYRLAAEQGNADAQFNLGFMYVEGRGVLQNDAEAVRWWRPAAEQGQAIAQFNLGLMYDQGRTVRQDDAEAVRWWRLAAEQGQANAQLKLGVAYATADGACRRMTLKPRSGSVSPPSRATPMPNTSSASCTAPVMVSRRIMCLAMPG